MDKENKLYRFKLAAKRRKARSDRKALIEIYNKYVADNNKSIGFKAYRLDHSGKVRALPPFMARILKACEELINNPYRFKELEMYGGRGIHNSQCRRILARVLAVILARAEYIDGRIGVPKESGLDTITHKAMMDEYVLRFGVNINDSTWYNAYAYIVRAGYINTHKIVLKDEREESEQGSGYISIASYKQITHTFIRDLKVTLYKNIAQEIYANRLENLKKRLQFEWVSVHQFKTRFMKAVGAPTPNLLAFAYPPHPTPH